MSWKDVLVHDCRSPFRFQSSASSTHYTGIIARMRHTQSSSSGACQSQSPEGLLGETRAKQSLVSSGAAHEHHARCGEPFNAPSVEHLALHPLP